MTGADRSSRTTALRAAMAPVDEATRRIETAVGAVLAIGVVASCLVMAVGAVLTLAASSTRAGARRALGDLRRGVVHPAALRVPHTVSGVVHGVAHGDGPAVVLLGVVLLIATPIVRVAVAVASFALQRNRPFTIVTTVVLAVLLASFALG